MATEQLILQLKARGVTLTRKQLDKLDKSAKKAGSSMKGMVAAVGGIYAIGKAFSYVVGVGKDFTKSQSNLAAILGTTSDSLGKLDKTAKQLGATTKFTASQVVQLQTEFAKLGFSSEQIVNAQEATLALASAVNVDLATAATVAGQTVNAFGLQAEDTQRVVDVMAKSFSSSALDMDKFRNSMTYASVVSKQMGLSVEATTGLLGKLADVGIDGSISGTALRRVFLEMGNEASKLSKKVGFAVKSDEDLFKALKILKKEGIGTTEMMDLVGKRAVSSFGAMIEMAEGAETLTEALENAGGTAQMMADEQLDNLEGDMLKLTSATEGFSIELYENFEPSIRSATQMMTSFMGWLDPNIVKGFIVSIALAGTAFVGLRIKTALAKRGVISLSGAMKTFAMSSGGTLLILAAIATTVVALAGGFGEAKEQTADFSSSIQSVLDQASGSFDRFGKHALEANINYALSNEKATDSVLALSGLSKEAKDKELTQIKEKLETTQEELDLYNKAASGIAMYGNAYEKMNQVLVTNLNNIEDLSAAERGLLALSKDNVKTIQEWTSDGILNAEQLTAITTNLDDMDSSLTKTRTTINDNTTSWHGGIKAVQKYYSYYDAGIKLNSKSLSGLNKDIKNQTVYLDENAFAYGKLIDNGGFMSRETAKAMGAFSSVIEKADWMLETGEKHTVTGANWGEYTSQLINTATTFEGMKDAMKAAFDVIKPDEWDALFESLGIEDEEQLTAWLQTYQAETKALNQEVSDLYKEHKLLEDHLLGYDDTAQQWQDFVTEMTKTVDTFSNKMKDSRNEMNTAIIVTLAHAHGLENLKDTQIRQIATMANLQDEYGNYLYTQDQVMLTVDESVRAGEKLSLSQSILAKSTRDVTDITKSEEASIASSLIALDMSSKKFNMTASEIDGYVVAVKEGILAGKDLKTATAEAAEAGGFVVGTDVSMGSALDSIKSYNDSEIEITLAHNLMLLELEYEKQVALAEAKGFGAEMADENYTYLEKLEQTYIAKKKKLSDTDDKNNAKKTANQISMYGELAGGIAGIWKVTGKNAELVTNLMYIEAIANTWKSASDAYRNAGGWPGGVLPAAISVTQGMAQVAQIGKARDEAKAAASETISAQYGADFVTQGLTHIIAGDNPGGQERVNITPLSSPNMLGDESAQSGNQNISISIEGGLISSEFVETELAEKIADGVRRGIDFGQS